MKTAISNQNYINTKTETAALQEQTTQTQWLRLVLHKVPPTKQDLPKNTPLEVRRVSVLGAGSVLENIQHLGPIHMTMDFYQFATVKKKFLGLVSTWLRRS